MKTYAEQVADRLTQFGQSLHGNKHGWKTKFARSLEMDVQTLNHYLMGERLPGNVLQARLRNYLNAPVDWILYGGDDKNSQKQKDSVIALSPVPVYSAVEDSKSWMVAEEVAEYFGVPVGSDHSLKGLIVKGNSMEPEIAHGDIVVISENAEVKKNDLCVVELTDGEQILRRVLMDKGTAILSSNQADEHQTMIIPQNKILKLYRVMQYIRKY